MQVRAAVPADLSAILDIYNDAVVHTTASWDLLPWTPAEHAQWFADRMDSDQPVLVAVAGDQVLGYATYGPFRSKAGSAATMEHAVYVHHLHGGQGIGRALMTSLIEVARASGVHALIGGISADNEASVEFHRSLGFVEVGRLPEVGRKFDRWLDLVLMQLMLTASDERPA